MIFINRYRNILQFDRLFLMTIRYYNYLGNTYLLCLTLLIDISMGGYTMMLDTGPFLKIYKP